MNLQKVRTATRLLIPVLLVFLLIFGSMPNRAAAAGQVPGAMLIQPGFLNADSTRPWVNLSGGNAVAEPAHLLASSSRAISLAGGDLNRDGLPELVVGYADGAAGWLVVYPANPAGKEAGLFGEPTQSLGLPFSPDWLGSGDLNGDGFADLLAAGRNQPGLTYFPGDGTGYFSDPQSIRLEAGITALALGEFGRQDGLLDVVAGLENGEVVLLAGAPGAPAQAQNLVRLPEAISGLAIGQLDEDFPFDLALTSGEGLYLLYGPDQFSNPALTDLRVEGIALGFAVRSLALGDFQAEPEQHLEIALLSAQDGSLHLLDRSGQPLEGSSLNRVKLNQPLNAGSAAGELLTTKTSTLAGDDLLILDSTSRQLQIFNASQSDARLGQVSSREVRAALPLHLNGDALMDLVVLGGETNTPHYLLTAPVHTFVVSVTWDLDDDTLGDGICDASGELEWGLCSLRAAIQEANASPGLDEIQLGFRVDPSSALPTITESLTLDGTQAAAEVNGSSLTSTYGLYFVSGSSTVSDIKFREFQWPAIYMHTGGNHLITRVQIGADNQGRGIVITTANNQLVENVISGNAAEGVAIFADGNVLKKNWIGPSSIGGSGWGNHKAGIFIFAADNTIIGGTDADRNVISGNWDGGISLGGGSAGTRVQGNYIGTNTAGLVALTNDGRGGVDCDNAPSTTVGGPTTAYGNLISGNKTGLTVRGNNTAGILIVNNTFGLNATGTASLPNLNQAILLKPTGSANFVRVENNYIAGSSSSGHGIEVLGEASPAQCIAHLLTDNILGTNPARTLAFGLGKDGIHIGGVSCTTLDGNTVLNSADDGIEISGSPAQVSATLLGNIVSGNARSGIELNTHFNQLENNIATYNREGVIVEGDANFLINTEASYNTGTGVAIYGDDNTLQGPGNDSFKILGNSYEGLILAGNQNTVISTYILVNGSSGVLVSGDENIIGGPANANLINGNYDGIDLQPGAAATVVAGNYIGLEANGSTPAGNARANIFFRGEGGIIGGSSAAMGNVIGDAPAGILIQDGAADLVIRYNKIGTNAAGTAGVGNQVGIKIENGRELSILQNQIAYNGDGILAVQGVNNQISQNLIYNNTRLGIDLMPAGVTTNDSGDMDSGPNNLQNFPVLTSAGISGGVGRVQGSFLGWASASYTLEFFSVPFCDVNGYGEGQVYLGNKIATSNSAGIITIDEQLATTPSLNHFITATATNMYGDTSEFSHCVKVGVLGGAATMTVNTLVDAADANLADGICDSDSGTAGEQCSLRAAIQQSNSNSGANTILLPAGEYTFSRAGRSENAALTGDLDITDELVLHGAGANVTVVNAAGLDRVFEIRTSALVTLSGITLKNGNPGNSAGGGISINSGANLTLEAVTIQDNQVGASAGGGGIYNLGTMLVSDSAILNNQAGMNGGGLYQWGASSLGTFLNSTFSGNQTAASGGGIFVESSAQVFLRNVTVTLNVADSDNLNGGDGGGLNKNAATLTLQNSIVAANVDNSHDIYEHGLADCAGTYLSNGYNLISDQALPYGSSTPGCSLLNGTADSLGGQWLMTNYLVFYAGLGPLQLNGGTTPSHSPIASGSGFTVDRGSPDEAGSGGSSCELLDQRGQPRPLDGGTDGIARCDRGAVELIPITISVGDVTVTEGSPAEFQLTLSGSPQINFSVDYSTQSGSATSGLDFLETSGTLILTAGGPTVYTIPVTTLTDTLSEGTETFQLKLTMGTYALIADGEGTGTILDGSPLPSIQINDVSASEGDAGETTTASFNVTLNNPSGLQVRVSYNLSGGSALAGEDFIQSQGTLIFPEGNTSQTLAVSLLGDNLQEGNETFTVTLSNPVNASLGDPTGIGTILDQDIPVLDIRDASTLEGDSGSSTLNFGVFLSKPSTSEIRVSFITSPDSAHSGSDYIHQVGQLIFAPGETTKIISISIVGDTVIEPTEYFFVTLYTPTGGAVLGDASATAEIADNDATPPSGFRVFLPLVVR